MSAARSTRFGFALAALGVLCPALAASAGPKPADLLKGPIKVTASHAQFDERGKHMLYRGNVRLVTRELELRGDRLELRQSGEGLYHARVTGAPARLTQAAAGDVPPMSAQAGEIVYDTGASTVALSGGAVLLRGTDQLTGERIRYNAVTRRIQANGVDGGQIELIIKPPAKDEKKK